MELRIFIEPQQGATYDDQLTIARLAEGLGFGAFFRSDHYLAMGVDGRPGPTDSWSRWPASPARPTPSDSAR
jgi:alkanesulfonate monooxygenase SsuD/methylene tetrahydromethanopterin reductase-like flavin-dependent oxidoreductase (luciferase family)